MLDKELLAVPLITGILGITIAILGYGGGLLLSPHKFTGSYLVHAEEWQFTHWTWAIWIATSALLALVSTFTVAAIMSMSLKRMRGGDPVLHDGYAAVKEHFKALAFFSLLSFGIIQALQYLESRLPFVGKILTFLGEVAWSVAAFFAIPVIVDSKEYVGPIDATKQSLGIIKTTWRESAVNQFTMGTIFLILILLELAIGISTTAASAHFVNIFLGAFSGLVMLVVLLMTILVSSAMDGIAKAVLYYYAITGEAPEHFDKELLRQAFTPRKAKKVFV
jgi:di/tricarboxylate transporter